MDLTRTAAAHARALHAGEYSATELAESCIRQARARESLGIFLSLDEEKILAQAKSSDERRAKRQTLSDLDGIPIAVKDNICASGDRTTCASKILENFVSPYDAHVIENLRKAGAVLFGRTNLDEFAMGSSTENSAFHITRNPWDEECVPGGSSGGSAAAVGSCVVPLALGSDTGGSIRQPASFCGIVGLKPTYGSVSRYGLVAFASSLDQIGPFARTSEDASLLLSAIVGHDKRDSTSSPSSGELAKSFEGAYADKDVAGMKIGWYLPEDTSAFSSDVLAALESAKKALEKKGAKLVRLHSKYWDYSIPIYYILATAEASSNLSRYDGIRYGLRAQGDDLKHVYTRSRTQGFGPEVKRRILLGTFVLSAGYFDAYYGKAQNAKALVRAEYESFFKEVDFILQPTAPTPAFKIGEKAKNPLAMYASDILTIAANLGGVPALNVPAGVDSAGLPIGLQLTGRHGADHELLRMGAVFESMPGFAVDFSRQISGGKPAAKAASAAKTAAAKPAPAAKKAAKSNPAQKKSSKKK
jgi:aspartyl-tRNA(Asn)/glutamyl-tRNA(Gln) amidotransferase subunit A